MIDWQTPIALAIVALTAGYAARGPWAALRSRPKRAIAGNPVASGCGGCGANGACGKQLLTQLPGEPGCR